MVLREQLKHYILRQIIFRIDFIGLFETDIEKYLIEVRDMLINYGAKDFSTRIENVVDLQMQMNFDAEKDLQNPFSVQRTSTNNVYTFKNIENNYVVEISKTFLSLTVDVNHGYKGFNVYHSLLLELLTKLTEVSKLFKGTRIGLRKKNICYINKLENVHNYFKDGVFEVGKPLNDGDAYNCKSANWFSLYEKDSFKVNYIRNLQEGIISDEHEENQTTYQTVLDIDVYIDDVSSVIRVMNSKDCINEIIHQQNNITFETYINSLNKDFVEKLKCNEFNDEEIKGVM